MSVICFSKTYGHIPFTSQSVESITGRHDCLHYISS